MALDAHKNLAVASVVTPPAPAASGVTLVVGAGQGARFPAVPFNVTIWPIDMAPDPATAEVARVTARSTDTLTLLRAQEGTTARAIVAGDFIAATITAKTITDIEAGTNFPLITTAGNVTAAAVVATTIRAAATTDVITLSGGPDIGTSAYVNLFGSAYAGTPAALDLVAPGLAGMSLTTTHAGGTIRLLTVGAERGRIHPSGGFSWGGTFDPGATTIHVSTGSTAMGIGWVNIAAGAIGVATAGVSGNTMNFYTSAGACGFISVNGTATAYNTTSDARLKTDRGRHTDVDVLRRTVIHDFTWIAGGLPGRGVFAQEAVEVAPFAVSVGSDEVDAEGRLTHPWGVDYSKYVPDLIAGWQTHDAFIKGTLTRLSQLEQFVLDMKHGPAIYARPSLYHRIRAAVAAWVPAWITP